MRRPSAGEEGKPLTNKAAIMPVFSRILRNLKYRKIAKNVSIGCATLGVVGMFGTWSYVTKSINFQRPRYWSDSFTMTPEALRMPYRKISFTTDDNIRLNGWFVPQSTRGEPSNRIIMCCCPYNHDKSTMLGICRGLFENGYSILLFNFRSHADFPTQQTIGYLESRDARAALEWLRSNRPRKNARIGILGASMGGAMSLKMAEESEDIVACATDCAFTTLYDVVEHRITLELPFFFRNNPRFRDFSMYAICLMNKVFFGYDLKNVGPATIDDRTGKNNLQKIRCPLLILHSEMDSVVPCHCATDIYNETINVDDSDKELIILPDVEHIGAYFNDEVAYMKRIVNFFDKHFDG